MGEIHWKEPDHFQYFFAMLAHDGRQRNVWFALGGAPPRDDRDAFVSVLAWRDGDHIISRITDASESPHRNEAIFAENVGVLVDREEVFPREDIRAWVFERIDEIVAIDHDIHRFLIGEA